MGWDPAGLKIASVSPNSVESNQYDVTLHLKGSGLTGSLQGVFVASDMSGTCIPCNFTTIVYGNSEATVRVCANGKPGGKYDLVVWLPPPSQVVDQNQSAVANVPVNATAYLKEALSIVSKPKNVAV